MGKSRFKQTGEVCFLYTNSLNLFIYYYFYFFFFFTLFCFYDIYYVPFISLFLLIFLIMSLFLLLYLTMFFFKDFNACFQKGLSNVPAIPFKKGVLPPAPASQSLSKIIKLDKDGLRNPKHVKIKKYCRIY